jgi:1-acyl-sn-glycerol-3-phosphate acyltransferase
VISSLVLLATVLALGIPSAAIFIPLALVTGNKTPLYRVAMGIMRIGYWMAGIRVHAEGMERVPAQSACIFMANHLSNLDPVVLFPWIPGRTSAFLKRSLMKIPILGYAMKMGEFVPVNRDGRVESAQESIRFAGRVLAKGIHITTFVEGTRSRDGRLQSFKKGPFYLAMETGAPCIPVSIYGTERMMAKGSLRIQPATAHVVFHDPVFPANYANREQLMAAVRAAVASGLPEWMRS